MRGGYTGRFAPSPTGPLHAGSLVAALASWLDARAQDGVWLVRIEDVDTPRCVPGAAQHILQQLAACGLVPDAEPVWQSHRSVLYQDALQALQSADRVYPCACTRKDIEMAQAAQGLSKPRHAELVYPGTCRHGLHGRAARAWRFRLAANTEQKNAFIGTVSRMDNAQPATESVAVESPPLTQWHDRRLGAQVQDVAAEVGDFVLKRADGLWAYQLAVVVDDAAQGVTHVVRGEDLADNTARQIMLQQALGLFTPTYLHTPLVCGAHGEKLSKQNGATALDVTTPLLALNAAAAVLGLPLQSGPHCTVADALAAWTSHWAAASYNLARD